MLPPREGWWVLTKDIISTLFVALMLAMAAVYVVDLFS